MSKFHINSLLQPTTGETCPRSPAVLMFERLVGDMHSTLQEKVWFDPSDWPNGFDWHGEVDAIWEGLAEDAFLLAKYPTRNAGGRLLCRGAGVIHRAIRAGSPAEIDAALNRLLAYMRKPASDHVHFLLKEAQVCLEQMADTARAEEANGPDIDLGLSSAA